MTASLADTALLLCDLQNDFLHPEGAYGRAGQCAPEIAALPARLRPLADALRAQGGLVIATQFTLVPGRGGEPIDLAASEEAASFSDTGRFRAGLVGPTRRSTRLQPVDVAVEKVAYSAFYMSRLEWVIRKLG
jgi:ureidoacrylate peracid hydrolase